MLEFNLNMLKIQRIPNVYTQKNADINFERDVLDNIKDVKFVFVVRSCRCRVHTVDEGKRYSNQEICETFNNLQFLHLRWTSHLLITHSL